jgi:hypothetical protein
VGIVAVEEAIAELIFELVLLPFRIFWWAFKRDFGLDEPAVSSEKPKGSHRPPPTPTVWDRELDGPDSCQRGS